VFYRVEDSRITLREYWFETKLLFWLALIVKVTKTRVRWSTDDLAVESLTPFAIDPAKLPPERLTRFARTIEQLQALGFESPIWLDEEDPYQATRNTIATLRHNSGKAFARVQCRMNFGRQPAKTKFFTTIISQTPGGYIVTGNGKYDMAWPKSHDTLRHRTMPVAGIWAEHLKRMSASVKPISAGELRDAEEAYHVSLRDFHLQRGVFQPLSDEELETYLAPSRTPVPTVTIPPPPSDELSYAPLAGAAPPPPLAVPDMLELATLDELRQLQNRKVNLRSTLFLLVISGVLFVLFSRGSDRQTDWEYIAIIVGLLLFHETGHFIAMKLFGYRNLRMFFIPGIGAAVTGRNYNAPAWKKIIVSLMGPLPGVLLGGALLFAGVHWHHELAYRVGLVAILLNVMNLIPLLPLDGGWVAHAALFARHPKLDLGFRLTAALAILAIGLFVPGLKFLPYLSLAMLFTLPMTYKQATIVGELRKVSGLGISPDNQTIPTDTARIIFARIRERFPTGLNAKSAAQQIASVFESLNAKPPSVGATFGLLTLHGATFVLGLAALGVAFVMHRGSVLRNGMFQAPSSLVSTEQLTSNGATPHGERNTLVARFKSAGEAYAALRTIEVSRPAVQFGQTLLVDFLPSESEKQRALFERFQKSADDVFVESDKMRAYVELSLKMPGDDAGKATIDELENYLAHASWRLTPPWVGDDVWPPAERKEADASRALLQKLQRGTQVDPAVMTPLEQQIDAAEKRGDDAEADRLDKQLRQAEQDAQAKYVESLRQEFGHGELIDAWKKIVAGKNYRARQEQLKAQISPMLGPWPANQPTDVLARTGFAADFGASTTHIDAQFYHADTGLIAMTRWLFAHGATDVHYSIRGQRFMERKSEPISDEE